MCSATSSGGSQLVRTVGPCAQTRVAPSGGLLSYLERSERRVGPFFVIPVDSSGSFHVRAERECRHCTHSFTVICCWPAMRGVAYEIIGTKFVLLAYAHVHIN